MPFTLAHPAAIFPMRRFACLATIPLLIGSMIPDFMRMVPATVLSQLPFLWRLPEFFAWMPESHTMAGTVLTDLPSGYALLIALIVFRAPLLSPLWDPHRAFIRDAIDQFLRQPNCWLIAIPSLLVGSWTHIAWDTLTHDSWIVSEHIAPLQSELFPGNDHPLPLYKVLQYVSSMLGVGAVVIWYRMELAKSTAMQLIARPDAVSPESAWRKYALSSVLGASLLCGVIIALTQLPDHASFYPVVSVILKSAMVAFGALYIVIGIAISTYAISASRVRG